MPNAPKSPAGLSDADEALRKEWSDLEWKLRTQLAFAFAAGKVVRAILEERKTPEYMGVADVVYKDGSKPQPYPPFLSDPQNRVQRNEFLAIALEHGLLHPFGYHEIGFKFPPQLVREVVSANHSL
jgi:hypothetical protein